MDAAIKAQWVAALRSGEYAQTTRVLTRVGEDGSKAHCCLGVLCELAVKSGLRIDVEASRAGDYVFYDANSSTLPHSVQEWAGIFSDNPNIPTEGLELPAEYKDDDGFQRAYAALAELNDGGFTFAQIADVIEERL